MSVSNNNLFLANDGAQETLNNVNNVIQGSGNIGDGNMTLINGKLGKIDANQEVSSAQSSQLVIQVSGRDGPGAGAAAATVGPSPGHGQAGGGASA